MTDGLISYVGGINLDFRSFDLNFEVNAIIYDASFTQQLAGQFFIDLKDSEQISYEKGLSDVLKIVHVPIDLAIDNI